MEIRTETFGKIAFDEFIEIMIPQKDFLHFSV